VFRRKRDDELLLVQVRAPTVAWAWPSPVARDVRLRLTLVQEGIAWSDDLDARNAWSDRVRVV
jgi:hypothetical protein